ncbi:MAG: histidine kinase [Gloeobacteraceae cyanobacterium ES-bin-316]|nr:histidine kinase [Ferruginibacter sp.]
MRIALPRYRSKDYLVLSIIVFPFSLGINTVIFRSQYFSSVEFFGIATAITGLSFSVHFMFCAGIAVLMKKRLPQEKDVLQRLGIVILAFLLMSGLYLFWLFNLYGLLHYFNYKFDDDSFVWAYFMLGISNFFLTFLHEGIGRYEKWKSKQDENDLLKETYQRSRLLGLKSQVNPHFLFNSLNSLSSLISDDEERAEIFLDEMSKVYRYMLRTDDEKLVTLAMEFKFLASYIYLLEARYGNGLQIEIDDCKLYEEKYLPPLALQTIVENAFTQNSISKQNPLKIKIQMAAGDLLKVTHNLQHKMIENNLDVESGLDNLVNKYELICEKKMTVTESASQRVISLPLLISNETLLYETD